jgi:hypothetical protein
MPLEIRELHIKATIDDGNGTPDSGASTTGPEENIDEIVRTCVDQVLKILREKVER